MTEYAELHSHSYFSLLDGASSPESLIEHAAQLGMNALALTDHDALYGAVRFDLAARSAGIKPIFGAELTVEGGHHLTLLVESEKGWSNLCALITAARQNSTKGSALLAPGVLEQHTDGLIALSGCHQGEVSAALLNGNTDAALKTASRYRDLFTPERYFIEVQRHYHPRDKRLVMRLAALAQRLDVKLVATNNVHYATPDGHQLQRILTCIKHNLSIDDAKPFLRHNHEFYLKSGAEMAALFADLPDAVSNTLRVAERCDYRLAFGLQDLPIFPTPDGQDAERYLRDLCEEGLRWRGISNVETMQQRLVYELGVIERSRLTNYFLIIYDIVRFAREQGILCQGRGSAASSLVAYALGISPINPVEHNLVFERFLSDERQAVPDVDIDFDAERREEVIQYAMQRYGTDHAAMACTFITYRARSSLRDVGKALGLPLEMLNRASRLIDTFKSGRIAESDGINQIVPAQTLRMLNDLCRQIEGFPRHLSIHNGGLIITASPLYERLPTEPAKMEDRIVVQWDKDSLEDAGLIKIDVLGLRMLSAVADSEAMLHDYGVDVDLDSLTFDDPTVYDMVTKADTIGVFQVESRAQQQVLPRLKPTIYNDLIVSISLIRPGPVQGQMVHPYLRRRAGKETVAYPHERLEPILSETLGVMLFQEQLLQVSREIAGFTPGQGELLRRALGRKNATAEIERFHTAFVEGADKQGVALAVAEGIFDAMRGFGGYSFPKSHAAAFAVIVYQSAWLKRFYPAAFCCALLNNQPMGFWSEAVIVNDARRHGVQFLPVDIQCSQPRCTLEGEVVRLGLMKVKEIGQTAAERIIEARREGAFTDLRDFCRRTQLAKRKIENLILAGAMDCFGKQRRALIWALGAMLDKPGMLDLDVPEIPLPLPAVSYGEVRGIEYSLTGVMLHEHPLALYRDWLDEQRVVTSLDLNSVREGKKVRVAGLNVMHQAPPTAKGMHFLTLEDEYGFSNIVIRPKIYPKYRLLLRTAPLLMIEGEIEREGEVINVLMTDARPIQDVT